MLIILYLYMYFNQYYLDNLGKFLYYKQVDFFRKKDKFHKGENNGKY